MWRVPKGSGRAWPGFETTRPATDQPPCATVVEGAGGSGGHGRASRSTTPSEARVWRSRGRPDPTAPATPTSPQANTRQPHRSEGPGRVLVGGVRAWPGFETTRPATDQPPCATVVEGAGGSGGHGRASRSTTPSRRLACGDLAGGRTRRRPQHQRHHKQHAQEGRRPPAHTAVRPAEQNARQPVRAAARSRN